MQEEVCRRDMAEEAPHACEAACGGPSLEEKKQARKEGTAERNHPKFTLLRCLKGLW